MPRRLQLALIAALAALALAGCGTGAGPSKVVGSTLTVHVSLPLRGASAPEGQAIEDGMKLALADSGGKVGSRKVEAVYLDDTAGTPPQWDQARVADNARRASQDITAIAYLGDLESGATRVSLPITNQAQMAQVSPASTAVDLTRSAGGQTPQRFEPSDKQTFARVVPADDVQALAAAAWAKKLGAKKVATLSTGEEFGDVVTIAFGDQARKLGLKVVAEQDLGKTNVAGAVDKITKTNPDLVYFGGTPEKALTPLQKLAGKLGSAKVMSSDALLVPGLLLSLRDAGMDPYLTSPFIDTSKLPPAGKAFASKFRKQFGHPPAPAAAYGYESMALLIDAIKRTGSNADDREKVIASLLATRNRRSVLGTYSLDEFGDTTLRTLSGYRVQGGKPRFETLLQAP